MCDRARWDDHEVGSDRLVFERMRGEYASAGDVRGAYSRAAWLPVVGPTAWLVWGVLADRLSEDVCVDCSFDELGLERRFGYSRVDVASALLQLARYGLAFPERDDRWQVATACPLLPDALIPRAARSVQVVHQRRLRPSKVSPLWRARWAAVFGDGPCRHGGNSDRWKTP
jgi:hypothetical protein